MRSDGTLSLYCPLYGILSAAFSQLLQAATWSNVFKVTSKGKGMPEELVV